MNSEWKGTSLKFYEKNCFINLLKQEGISLRENGEEVTLENQKNYFIYENEFIKQSTNLLSMITKYTQKEYSDRSKVYFNQESKFKIIQSIFSDLNKYVEVVRNNVIDGDIREFNISINVLNDILDDSRKSRLFLDILIMFALLIQLF